jgi:hypothetical protein
MPPPDWVLTYSHIGIYIIPYVQGSYHVGYFQRHRGIPP